MSPVKPWCLEDDIRICFGLEECWVVVGEIRGILGDAKEIEDNVAILHGADEDATKRFSTCWAIVQTTWSYRFKCAVITSILVCTRDRYSHELEVICDLFGDCSGGTSWVGNYTIVDINVDGVVYSDEEGCRAGMIEAECFSHVDIDMVKDRWKARTR